MDACLAPHDGEPSVAEVRRAALRHAGVSRRDVRGAVLGTRLKGLLPKVRFFALATDGKRAGEGVLKDAIYPNWPYRLMYDDTLHRRGPLWGGALTLDLRRLVSGRATFKTLAVVRYRHALIARITHAYFDRREALLRLCSRRLSPPQRAWLRLRVRRLGALLDELSGGRFLKKKRSKHPKGGAHASK